MTELVTARATTQLRAGWSALTTGRCWCGLESNQGTRRKPVSAAPSKSNPVNIPPGPAIYRRPFFADTHSTSPPPPTSFYRRTPFSLYLLCSRHCVVIRAQLHLLPFPSPRLLPLNLHCFMRNVLKQAHYWGRARISQRCPRASCSFLKRIA